MEPYENGIKKKWNNVFLGLSRLVYRLSQQLKIHLVFMQNTRTARRNILPLLICGQRKTFWRTGLISGGLSPENMVASISNLVTLNEDIGFDGTNKLSRSDSHCSNDRH